MISEEVYLESLEKLKQKEKLNLEAITNGQQFEEAYLETLKKAKNENKKIFLLFYMEGCDGCNVVKYLIDNSKTIKNYLNKYLLLYCDISKTKTGLAQKYNLYSFPAYFIINSNEKIIKKRFGITVMKDPERDFLSWLMKNEQ